MQVFGLPGHVIRNGRAASRLLAATTCEFSASRRRDAARPLRITWPGRLKTCIGGPPEVGVSQLQLRRPPILIQVSHLFEPGQHHGVGIADVERGGWDERSVTCDGQPSAASQRWMRARLTPKSLRPTRLRE